MRTLLQPVQLNTPRVRVDVADIRPLLVELAPTTELRHVQYREDDRLGVGKRLRVELAPEYRERYRHEILDRVDLAPLVAELPVDRASALFCVEQDPEACHRSLVTECLAEEYDLTIVHLLPDASGS